MLVSLRGLTLLSFLFGTSLGKIHHLQLKGDSRRFFPITTFGFYRNGYLSVDVSAFRIHPAPSHDQLFGFSLEKTANPYTDLYPEPCELEHLRTRDTLVQRVLLTFNLTALKVTIRCSEDMHDLHIYEDLRQVTGHLAPKQSLHRLADTELMINPGRRKNKAASSAVPHRSKRSALPPASPPPSSAPSDNSSHPLSADERIVVPEVKCDDVQLPITLNKEGFYNFSFVVLVSNKKEEGLYNLLFHNCHNYRPGPVRSSVDMELSVVERNPDDNFLSAGEMPLPALFFMMSMLFFLSSVFWFFILKKSNQPVFKIHYLMGVLVVIKSLSLLFHAINYHYIQIQGTHMEAWAVMFYIMHLLKGALLFTVLALIGSGWAFIKGILSSREKKIFLLVIPLQIIANTATIIIEETDEWEPQQALWDRLLLLIDFLCCAAILLPVVWSIRHLQEASQTDGKAAVNLSKLVLFRHFYVMVVCYIYFTRIIVYLLRMTVPFQYSWLDDMFREMATYVFFVMTGYKFRPAASNPYFLLAAYNEDEEDVVLTRTALTEGVTRLGGGTEGGTTKVTNRWEAPPRLTDQDDEQPLIGAAEDSHELD